MTAFVPSAFNGVPAAGGGPSPDFPDTAYDLTNVPYDNYFRRQSPSNRGWYDSLVGLSVITVSVHYLADSLASGSANAAFQHFINSASYGFTGDCTSDGTFRVGARSQSGDSFQASTTASGAIQTGVQYHLVYTCDFTAKTIEMWQDGVKVIDASGMSWGQNTWQVQSGNYGGGWGYAGELENRPEALLDGYVVQGGLFNKHLSAQERADLQTGIYAEKVTGCVNAYSFDPDHEGASGAQPDRAGSITAELKGYATTGTRATANPAGT